MARPAEETLVRRRRRALLVAAAVLAIPVAVAVRNSGDWTTFAAAFTLLAVLIAVGSTAVLGPWAKNVEDLYNQTDPLPARRRMGWIR